MIRPKRNEITAGSLKDRCTLIPVTYASDGRGGQTPTDGTGIEVWCHANPTRDSRQLLEAQLTFLDALDITIRYQNIAIDPNWKIEFNGKTYTIHTIKNVYTRYQYWEILCYSKE